MHERMFYTRRVRAAYREEPCRTALNRVRGMPFEWSLNPYMGCAHRCSFCYVRAFEQRADRPSGSAYGSSIRVKVNIVEVLARELARRSWRGAGVAIGAATDPYQPAEGRYRLTRGCLESLAAAANPFAVITRSPLIVRDLDLLVACARRADVGVAISIATLDADLARRIEPTVAPPAQRLRAVAALAQAGVRVGVAVAPVLPDLTDDVDSLRGVVRAAADAGAQHVWHNALNLGEVTRDAYFAFLEDARPDLVARYARLFRSGRYAESAYVHLVAERMRAARTGVRFAPQRALAPDRTGEQLSLGC